MYASTDPRIIQYAATITGLPEYHFMKETLEEVFGEDSKILFENIEDMKQVIIDTYSDKEYGFITQNENKEESKVDNSKSEKVDK
jgi:hypothetical protein